MSKIEDIAGRTHQQILATAYHEAGHVVIGYEFGFPLGKKSASIVPDGETAGRADIRYGSRYRPEVDLSERARFRVEQYALFDFALRKHNGSSVRARFILILHPVTFTTRLAISPVSTIQRRWKSA
jgi:hypothetical protein